MKVAVLRERWPDELRVAVSPDTVKKLTALGANVSVESGAGTLAAVTDDALAKAGATIEPKAMTVLEGADVLLKVRAPLAPGEGDIDEVAALKPGALLIGTLNPYGNEALLERFAAQGIIAVAMELMPRITRAQSMDVLSSQSNLAGYRAVIDGAAAFGRAFPMMMTAAGTVPPARAFILGAGVAGLQAIATARRLGAIVSAFDVRMAAKEQVESLGASFLDVQGQEDLETKGGYAREASADQQQRQRDAIHAHLKKQDLAVCTALIPGRKAPELITEEMVRDMKPGSVIVDLAVEQGGNCALSQPGEVVEAYGVRIVGHRNVPGRVAADASSLYARNLLAFLDLLVDKESKTIAVPWDDEIVKGVVLTREGRIVHERFAKAETAALAPSGSSTAPSDAAPSDAAPPDAGGSAPPAPAEATPPQTPAAG